MDVGVSKYSIAWFKLAEFVMRREKEKALGIFKLLSHSLSDKGLVSQLEGDIFLSFSDIDSAKKSYLLAAQNYTVNNKILSAAAVYEHLLSINPNNSFEYSFKMLELYLQIQNKAKIRNATKLIIENLGFNNNINKLGEYINRSITQGKEQIFIFEMIFLDILKYGKISNSYLYKYLEEIIDGLKQIDSKKLDNFCQKLESLDPEIYKYALTYLLVNKP